ncbi:hypothetical protein Tsp_03359, partial [Trichinella spiralis]|uniref:hypothetical protein n=1 Tax=Trichinella spiralis TaxID=6334 RepID=UPI0001EFCBA7
MAFSSRPSVPLLITNSKKEFVTAIKYVKSIQPVCRLANWLFRLVAADATQIAFPMVSIFVSCISYKDPTYTLHCKCKI